MIPHIFMMQTFLSSQFATSFARIFLFFMVTCLLSQLHANHQNDKHVTSQELSTAWITQQILYNHDKISVCDIKLLGSYIFHLSLWLLKFIFNHVSLKSLATSSACVFLLMHVHSVSPRQSKDKNLPAILCG